MLKFDPAQIEVEIVQLKTVTMAVGGSISVLDPAFHRVPKKSQSASSCQCLWYVHF